MGFRDDAGHPALSSGLVHMCGRARQDRLPSDVAEMTPQARLGAILRGEAIQGFAPYGSQDPVVCFTEAKRDGVAYLIKEKGWAPWGLVLERDAVYQDGGGPVWYARSDVWDTLSSEIKAWAVRLEPGRAEWLHEREWRVPTPKLGLRSEMIRAVIVADPQWHPGYVPDLGVDPASGEPELVEVPPRLIAGVKRWCWNHATGKFDELPPWIA
ncbi:hypothetical protein [Amycolatopsis taiwanensis]|uniref:Uncharacterized protein n=1 Tax=Amycolatopsis taiwanensis TaxID=342230 RepID=A0A9W6VES2_9PSEU|nr:hypothetical protein [Amycolatopsis taiwanensis]GLY68783.1 hypothetical protein Atai01_54020 [Amycolatopsis taiwanensis]